MSFEVEVWERLTKTGGNASAALTNRVTNRLVWVLLLLTPRILRYKYKVISLEEAL